MKISAYHPLLIASIVLLFAACGPKNADLTAPYTKDGGRTTVLVTNMQYDSHGLPTFGPILPERPSEAGGRYAAVYYSGDRPVKSYDIAVVGERKPDATKPLEVLFQWTGQGFLVGASMLWGPGQIQLSGDRDGDMVVLAGALAPVVVMTAGGFIVGVVAGVISAGEELRYALLRPQDVVMSVTIFERDGEGRLIRLRMFLPDEKTEVVRTEYSYEGKGTVPVKAESRSYPENKVRTIGR